MPTPDAVVAPTDFLFQAICEVEFNHNPTAWNRSEDARGICQIRKGVIQDVNRILASAPRQMPNHTPGPIDPSHVHPHVHDDVWDVKKSYRIFQIYTQHWADKAVRTGHSLIFDRYCNDPANPELLSRIWNGGPNGWRHPLSTNAYWLKVSKVLLRLQTEASLYVLDHALLGPIPPWHWKIRVPVDFSRLERHVASSLSGANLSSERSRTMRIEDRRPKQSQKREILARDIPEGTIFYSTLRAGGDSPNLFLKRYDLVVILGDVYHYWKAPPDWEKWGLSIPDYQPVEVRIVVDSNLPPATK